MIFKNFPTGDMGKNNRCALRGEFSGRGTIRCGYLMTGRNGGAGKGIFSTNNMSFAVGDREESVLANRQQVKHQAGLRALLTAGQVHGSEVYCLDGHIEEDLNVDGYDALVTDRKGVGLMIQQADCQAVLLFDPRLHVIAAVHCGWRGSVQNILVKTVAAMTGKYGTRPADLHGKISPSLGPCCAEFIHFRRELPEDFRPYMKVENYFDFWQLSIDQLGRAGVCRENIEAARVCTRCSKDFFSYREACALNVGRTGRNSSLIFLRETGE